MSKIYVGNLPWRATDAQLSQLFGAHGGRPRAQDVGHVPGVAAVAVDVAALIRDRADAVVPGAATPAEAAKAIQTLNGFQMGGRALKVNEAQAKTERPRRW